MDRRKNKTHRAILSAFSELLIKMPYESITVQNIIERADVGRSTFYSHFETKDDLVYALCEEMFDHVMSKEQILCEKTHDFSHCDSDIASELTHILYHVKFSHADTAKILIAHHSELFLRYFKNNLASLFRCHSHELNDNVPFDYLIDFLSSSFAQTVIYWVKNKLADQPEAIVQRYMTVIRLQNGKMPLHKEDQK